jgi:hypothetical protein
LGYRFADSRVDVIDIYLKNNIVRIPNIDVDSDLSYKQSLHHYAKGYKP